MCCELQLIPCHFSHHAIASSSVCSADAILSTRQRQMCQRIHRDERRRNKVKASFSTLFQNYIYSVSYLLFKAVCQGFCQAYQYTLDICRHLHMFTIKRNTLQKQSQGLFYSCNQQFVLWLILQLIEVIFKGGSYKLQKIKPANVLHLSLINDLNDNSIITTGVSSLPVD